MVSTKLCKNEVRTSKFNSHSPGVLCSEKYKRLPRILIPMVGAFSNGPYKTADCWGRTFKMDSPILGSTDNSLLQVSPDRKVAKNKSYGAEVNKWMKLKSLDEDILKQDELQKQLKMNILNSLREMQKEHEETSWMYTK